MKKTLEIMKNDLVEITGEITNIGIEGAIRTSKIIRFCTYIHSLPTGLRKIIEDEEWNRVSEKERMRREQTQRHLEANLQGWSIRGKEESYEMTIEDERIMDNRCVRGLFQVLFLFGNIGIYTGLAENYGAKVWYIPLATNVLSGLYEWGRSAQRKANKNLESIKK